MSQSLTVASLEPETNIFELDELIEMLKRKKKGHTVQNQIIT
jgi:hypothetical protein